MNSSDHHLTPSEQETSHGIEHEIPRAIKGIRYGTVEVIIHDSKVVQIERKEKVRFDKGPSAKGR